MYIICQRPFQTRLLNLGSRYSSIVFLTTQQHIQHFSNQVALRVHHRRRKSALSTTSLPKSRRRHILSDASSVTFEENPAKYCRGGYHPVHLGEVFNNRYQVVSKLGYGTYSTVWLTRDLAQSAEGHSSQSSGHVALKILTADSYGTSRPVYELDILRHIRKTDTSHQGYRHVAHLLDTFVHEGPNGNHLCLVMELMGQSVMNLQNSFPNKQLPVQIGRKMARQVLCALDWLHDSCGIIHTDIKPDNILVQIPDIQRAVDNYLSELKQSSINQSEDFGLISRPINSSPVPDCLNSVFKIIDFGVASWKDKHLTDWIQPPSLRAPEVFLGAPWDGSVDVWGFGCVIYELLQGRVLFRGRPGAKNAWTAEEDQIAQMIELFGPFPASLREGGKLSSKYFDTSGNLLHIKQLYPYSLRALLAQTSNPSLSATDYINFESFLQSMLNYNSSERKTPKELLKEPWLLHEVSE